MTGLGYVVVTTTSSATMLILLTTISDIDTMTLEIGFLRLLGLIDQRIGQQQTFLWWRRIWSSCMTAIMYELFSCSIFSLMVSSFKKVVNPTPQLYTHYRQHTITTLCFNVVQYIQHIQHVFVVDVVQYIQHVQHVFVVDVGFIVQYIQHIQHVFVVDVVQHIQKIDMLLNLNI